MVIEFILSWTYFTYSAVLLLDETSPNVFYLKNALLVSTMKTVIGGFQKEGKYKLEFELKDGSCYKFKLP